MPRKTSGNTKAASVGRSHRTRQKILAASLKPVRRGVPTLGNRMPQ